MDSLGKICEILHMFNSIFNVFVRSSYFVPLNSSHSSFIEFRPFNKFSGFVSDHKSIIL